MKRLKRAFGSYQNQSSEHQTNGTQELSIVKMRVRVLSFEMLVAPRLFNIFSI